MKGSQVIVRDCDGRPWVRRVWCADDHAVYVTSDEGMRRLMRGERNVMPIGFPREDVFQRDEGSRADPGVLYDKGQWDWSRLTVWKKGNEYGQAASGIRNVRAPRRRKAGRLNASPFAIS